MESSKNSYNVYIFNFNKNNEPDQQLLETTFKKFDCLVKTYTHTELTADGLTHAIDEIAKADHTLFRYIVFVVLNDTNWTEDTIRTSDRKDVMLHSGFLSKIFRNATLSNKKCLFLLQTNRSFPNLRDDRDYVPLKNTEEIIYICDGIYFYATLPDCPVPEFRSPFIQLFCEKFCEFGNEMAIDRICEKAKAAVMRIPEAGIPSIAIFFTDKTQRVFGKALTEEAKRDYFYEHFYTNY